MWNDSWNRGRRLTLFAILALLGFLAYHWFTPGLKSRAPYTKPVVYAQGESLFTHEWTPNDPLAKGDGLGPVFNAKSCLACHNQGGPGGGGDLAHNVNAFEVIPTRLDPDFHSGQIHAHAVAPTFRESDQLLRKLFPQVPNGVTLIGNCSISRVPLDPVRINSLNSTALFGAGWIDKIPAQTILYQERSVNWRNAGREITGDFTQLPSGRARLLAGGRVGRFGWKAQFATLEEFVAAACGNELGLGTPIQPQATPIGRPVEEVPVDLPKKDFSALVGFVAGLPRPVEFEPPKVHDRVTVAQGRALFTAIGCAHCHVPDLAGVKGIYSDLLLHVIQDKEDISKTYALEQLEVPLPGFHPLQEEWRTPPLWGVADSAPYMHDGAAPTLHDAILRHRGDAAPVTKRYKNSDQHAIIAFLQTLKAPPQPPTPDKSHDHQNMQLAAHTTK